MPSTAHILETALLILVAFLVGCVIGALARRLTLPKAVAAKAAEAPTAVAASGPQLVVAPTIAPIARSTLTPQERIAAAAAGSSAKPEPVKPEPVKPEPEKTEALPQPDSDTANVVVALSADPITDFAPAHTPGLATSGREVPAPPAEAAAPSQPPSAEEPPGVAEPPGAEEPPDDPVLVVPLVEPEPQPTEVRAEDVPPIDEAAHVVDRPIELAPVQADDAALPAADDVAAETAESAMPAETTAVEAEEAVSTAEPAVPEPEPDAEPALPPEPQFTSADDAFAQAAAPPLTVDDPAPPQSDVDEAAAMRAIEGGWTPSAAVAPQQPAPEPELSRAEVEAAMASARNAVASAAAAAQAALADPPVDHPVDASVVDDDQLAFEAVEGAANGSFLASEAAPAPAPDGMDFEPERPRSGFGKPPALAAPRDGGKDNLRQIAGVTPDIEASLNHLGIYHYDQVAGWDHKAVVWLDHHLTLRGRIGREKWIDQAKSLVGRRPVTARPVRR